jgi:WD40 repeat protein
MILSAAAAQTLFFCSTLLIQGSSESEYALSARVSPDGSRLAVGYSGGSPRKKTEHGRVEIRDLKSGKLLREIRTSSLNCLAWGETDLLAVGHSDAKVSIYNASTSERVRSLEAEGGRVETILFSPKKKWIVSHMSESVRIWDSEGKLEKNYSFHARNSGHKLALSPDGATLAIGGRGRDKKTVLFDLASEKEIHTLLGHEAGLLDLLFSPDGKRLATASGDCSAAIWEVETGKLLFTLCRDAKDWVSSISFSPDGKQLACGSFDSKIRIYRTLTGDELKVFSTDKVGVWCLAYFPDGKSLFWGGDAGKTGQFQAP